MSPIKLTISSIGLAKMEKAVFSLTSNKMAKVKLTAIDGRFILRSAIVGGYEVPSSHLPTKSVVPAKAFCGVVDSFRGTDF